MKYCEKYLQKTLAMLSLTLVLLIGFSTSIAYAKEAKLSLPDQEQGATQVKQQMVSLNQSTLSELITLKGVGQTKAHAIMSYRQQFGDFKSINEVTQVSGIGEKIVNENKVRLVL